MKTALTSFWTYCGCLYMYIHDKIEMWGGCFSLLCAIHCRVWLYVSEQGWCIMFSHLAWRRTPATWTRLYKGNKKLVPIGSCWKSLLWSQRPFNPNARNQMASWVTHPGLFPKSQQPAKHWFYHTCFSFVICPKAPPSKWIMFFKPLSCFSLILTCKWYMYACEASKHLSFWVWVTGLSLSPCLSNHTLCCTKVRYILSMILLQDLSSAFSINFLPQAYLIP